jgi:D-beta-D-heptose 7-phosphate kinase/D-beta-D-heptose 1-phosphate adenosyltransferase
LLDSFSRVRLLVLGDLVLDEYIAGDVTRVSPEAPVPVVRVSEESVALGGAANVVRNVVALGGRACFCALRGDDRAGEQAAALLTDLGIDESGLVTVAGRPTTRKTRVVARSQQVVRFDRETSEPPSAATGRAFLAAVDRALAESDAVVVEDYGKGLFGRGIGAAAMRRFRAAGTPVLVDPKSALIPWRGAEVLKPNLREAEALSGVTIRGPRDLARAASRLRKRIGGGAVLVTQGREGITIFDDDGPGTAVPTVAREVFDVQGAGDTTAAALALALRSGASLREAAVIANAAAGVVVEKSGTATAQVEEVRALLPAAVAAAREDR